jgi:tRNA pseudouridine65 synthase
MKSLPVLYQDEHLVAVNKPSGLLVHRSDIDRHESEYAMQILRDQLGQWVYPLHRLDKATSGVLLFALDRESARLMTRSFTEGTISKSYLAVVRGFTRELERIDHPLNERRDKMRSKIRSEMIDKRAARDKPERTAVTEYRRLATVELPRPAGRYPTARYSLVQAAPLNGRMHQIRRHLKHISHPIIGDTTYGDGKQNEFFRTEFNCRRLLLHSQAAEFLHPYSGKQVRIHAPLDEDFGNILRKFLWEAIAP